MNSEILICQAAFVIEKFLCHNDSICYLDIAFGNVIACKGRPANRKHPLHLVITKHRQKYGFSDAEWRCIGTALLNLYNKEVACQAHQKH